MQTETAAPASTGEYKQLPIRAIVASKTNPRTHFDDAYLGELATSIRDKGLLNPILVRPLDSMQAVLNYPEEAARNGAKFEIVAGECRFRASRLADLKTVPAIVREMSNEQVLEAQLEENIHRKDLTPLEEAAGYRRLINTNLTKHSAESIATRIGMSVSYVWDRLKLNDLIPEAKAILEQGLMTVGHGILISRLKPADQERAIVVDRQRGQYDPRAALWRADHGFHFDAADPVNKNRKAGKYDGVKPCSVRELEAWIRDHVRFDVAHAAQAQPFVFEEAAARVETAAAQPGRGKKVVAITHEYRVADDARDESERTYGRDAWYRADGREKSKTCDHAVLGVVVAGEGYGSTLQVCVARDACDVHFAAVIKQKEKTAKLRESGKTTQADEQQRKQREAADARAKKEIEEREAWTALRPIALQALADHLKGTKPDSTLLRSYLNRADEVVELIGALTPAKAGQAIAIDLVLNNSWNRAQFLAAVKPFKFNLGKVEQAVKAKPAAAKKPAKGRR